MRIQLKTPIDLYDGPEGKEKLIKRGIITLYAVDTQDIISHQEIPNTKGNIYKDRCKVFIRDIGPLLVKHSFEELEKILQSDKTKIGFLKDKKIR